jgi:hypothetical protein
MGFYTVLHAADHLAKSRGWRLARCRISTRGPLRYELFDESGQPMFDVRATFRYFGLTLPQILALLAENREIELANQARSLLTQLEETAWEKAVQIV